MTQRNLFNFTQMLKQGPQSSNSKLALTWYSWISSHRHVALRSISFTMLCLLLWYDTCSARHHVNHHSETVCQENASIFKWSPRCRLTLWPLDGATVQNSWSGCLTHWSCTWAQRQTGVALCPHFTPRSSSHFPCSKKTDNVFILTHIGVTTLMTFSVFFVHSTY